MDPTAGRSASIEAGAIAGVAGLGVFLALHHAWIMPIWFIAPVGAIVAAGAGAAMGAAYAELRPALPREPWTVVGVMALFSGILAPAMILAELRGPIYAIGPGGAGTLLVPPGEVLLAFAGLLASTALTGGLLGAVVGRTRRAAGTSAAAGLALGVGPGHNIPFLGGTTGATAELAILAAAGGVASIVLVAVARRRPHIAPDAPGRRDAEPAP